MDESPPIRLLTGEQVADIFGVRPRTVKDMARRGDLRPIRLGYRTTRYDPNDVAALLRRRTATGPAAA